MKIHSDKIKVYLNNLISGFNAIKLVISLKVSVILNPNQYGGGHYAPPIVFPKYLRNDLS